MLRQQKLSQFTLIFSEKGAGVRKRVEFQNAEFNEVFEFVQTDKAKRVVSVWENGAFICHLVHRKDRLYITDSPGFDPKKQDANFQL